MKTNKTKTRRGVIFLNTFYKNENSNGTTVVDIPLKINENNQNQEFRIPN